MSLVRLLGFATLECGCVVGRYSELPGARDVVYVEEKGSACVHHHHRRNHALPRRFSGAVPVPVVVVAKAS